jgi:flagellar hook-length control protein FliK
MPGVIPVKKGKGKSALGAFSRLLEGLKSNSKGNFFKEAKSEGKISMEDGKKSSLSLQKTNFKEKKKSFSAVEDGTDLNSVFLEAVSGKGDKIDAKDTAGFSEGRGAGQALEEKERTEKIFSAAVSLKGEKAPPVQQAHEIPVEPEAEAEFQESSLKVSMEDGERGVFQLSAEAKSAKASKETRPIENAAQNAEADIYPVPEETASNLSALGTDNAENTLRNKPAGNQVQKAETVSVKKPRERPPSDAKEPHVRDTAVTDLAREAKPQTAVPVSSEQEISVELRSPEALNGSLERNSGPAPAEGRLGELLARELNQSLSTDIVKHASIILRGSDSGLIRLTLKPETLGNVKIRLEMSENKIIGHIIVESREALRAFEQEAPVLEAAFKDAGFDGASLDMSLASGNGSDGRGERGGQDFLSSLRIAARYDAASGLAEDGSGSKGMYTVGQAAINMLA